MKLVTSALAKLLVVAAHVKNQSLREFRVTGSKKQTKDIKPHLALKSMLT